LDTKDYIPKYLAIIKLAWLIVIQEVYKQRREEIRRYKSYRLGSKEAGVKATSHYHLTRGLVCLFITIANNGKDPIPI
jgi:hypothetical protein